MGTVSSVSRRQGRRRRWTAQVLTPYLYLAPAAALLITWTYKPLVETFQLSFFRWNMVPTSVPVYVGTEKYVEVLALPEMQQALRNTAVYVALFMVFSLVIPLGVALLSSSVGRRAKAGYQALIFLPFLITPVATGAVWRWILTPEGGAVSQVLALFGVRLGNVFRDPDVVLGVIVVIVGWQILGFGVLVISAGLSGIHPDYAAAAAVDGAGRRRITWRITLPLLSPSLVFIALMTVLLTAQWTYPMIDLLTQGGPSGASTNIYYLLFQFGFRTFDAGLSAAAGILFFVLFMAVAWAFMELSERLSFYDN